MTYIANERYAPITLLGLVALLGSSACGDDAEADGALFQRGSAECQLWQRAMCHRFEGCTDVSFGECMESYGGFECRDAAAAASCAREVEAAQCSAISSSCEYAAVVDASPAVAGCTEFVETYCTEVLHCGYEYETCIAQVNASLFCDEAIGLGEGFEACLAEAKQGTCEALETCTEVFIVE